MKKLNIVFVISVYFLILFSCRVPEKITTSKYREKNDVDILKVESVHGDVTINGWANDFIEINTKKVLESGLITDLNLMKIMFENDGKTLLIRSKIPARISGSINFEIYVPYILHKIYIVSNNNTVYINEFLGDIDLKNNNCEIDVQFYGQILRVNSDNSKINLDIKSTNTSDIVINTKKSKLFVNFESHIQPLITDIISLNSDIVMNISKNISHKFFIINKNNKITVNYDIIKDVYIENEYTCLIGYRGNDSHILNLNISNTNGKILLKELNN